MSKKIKISNTAFYTFFICISIAAATVTVVGYSILLSGTFLDGHIRFRIWAVVLSFTLVAILAFLYIIGELILITHHRSFRKSPDDAVNTSNTENT